MVYLGVELHPKQAASKVAHGGHRAVGTARQYDKPGRRRFNAVAVRHPHRLRPGREQRVIQHGFNLGRAVFTLAGRRHLAVQGVGQRLHAIADPQDGQAELEHIGRDGRRPRSIDGSRAAGKDVATRLAERRPYLFGGGVPRKKLAVNLRLTHAPGNQLAVL